MLDLARRMADTLRGVLVDDNRRQLTEAMLDPFRRQIGQYQTQLAAKGLPAGGPLTLRLFS
jgi:FtsZ-interacting cell division protein ZipA